jgi:hypothetical protein
MTQKLCKERELNEARPEISVTQEQAAHARCAVNTRHLGKVALHRSKSKHFWERPRRLKPVQHSGQLYGPEYMGRAGPSEPRFSISRLLTDYIILGFDNVFRSTRLLREGSDLPVHGPSIILNTSHRCASGRQCGPNNSSRTLDQYQVDREAIPQEVK